MITTITLNPSIDKTYWISPFRAGESNRVLEIGVEAGGKGVNVAKVLASLDKNVTCTGFLGGSNGIELKKRLSSFQTINQDWIEIEGNTRNCLNIIDKTNLIETEILEVGPEITEASWNQFLATRDQIAEKSKVVLISGSLPKGLGEKAYYQLVTLLKGKNRLIGIDTSGAAFRECLAARPDIIKPNIHELEDYCGRELTSIEEIAKEAKRLYELGIKYVFVSLGAKGAIAVSDSGIVHAEIPSVEVLNTVGSGDATLAGIVARLEEDRSLEEVIKSGMAAGIANALQRVAGSINKTDYLYYLDRVKIKKLE
jgi:tagatose 6-phosphate kinase